MQSQTIHVELTINGLKVLVGYQFLEHIAWDIPDVKANQAVFEELAKSDNFEVRENISKKDTLNKATVHMLLQDSHQDVVRNILGNANLAKMIEEDAIYDIIKKDNIQLLCNIASNIEDFALCDTCKLAKVFSNHPNPCVRSSLVRWRASEAVTTKIIQKLTQDEDVDVANAAKEELNYRNK